MRNGTTGMTQRKNNSTRIRKETISLAFYIFSIYIYIIFSAVSCCNCHSYCCIVSLSHSILSPSYCINSPVLSLLYCVAPPPPPLHSSALSFFFISPLLRDPGQQQVLRGAPQKTRPSWTLELLLVSSHPPSMRTRKKGSTTPPYVCVLEERERG